MIGWEEEWVKFTCSSHGEGASYGPQKWEGDDDNNDS